MMHVCTEVVIKTSHMDQVKNLKERGIYHIFVFMSVFVGLLSTYLINISQILLTHVESNIRVNLTQDREQTDKKSSLQNIIF